MQQQEQTSPNYKKVLFLEPVVLLLPWLAVLMQMKHKMSSHNLGFQFCSMRLIDLTQEETVIFSNYEHEIERESGRGRRLLYLSSEIIDACGKCSQYNSKSMDVLFN